MKRMVALTALTILTACDYVVRNDFRGEREDRVYRAAMDDYRAGRMDAAMSGLEKVVRNDPSNASARFQLACLQQDVKKDFLSAFCSYREFLVQQPECDRAKLARERLAVCEKEAARTLAAKYGLNASDKLVRELDAVREELKSDRARVAAAEKELTASQERIRALSADRDRLLSVIRGEGSGDADETAPVVMKEKDLLDEDEDETAPVVMKETDLPDGDLEGEVPAGSSLLPVQKPTEAVKREKKEERAPDRKWPPHPKTYVVKDGDTLYGIAKRFYGSILPWKMIRDANKALISSDNRLKAGDTIVLP